jgi:hypothetical protein
MDASIIYTNLEGAREAVEHVWRQLVANGWSTIKVPHSDPEFCQAIIRKKESEVALVWSTHAVESHGLTIRFIAAPCEDSRREILQIVGAGLPEDRVV